MSKSRRTVEEVEKHQLDGSFVREPLSEGLRIDQLDRHLELREVEGVGAPAPGPKAGDLLVDAGQAVAVVLARRAASTRAVKAAGVWAVLVDGVSHGAGGV